MEKFQVLMGGNVLKDVFWDLRFSRDFISYSVNSQWLFLFINHVSDLFQSVIVTVSDQLVYCASYICLQSYVQFCVCSNFPSLETRFDIIDFFSFSTEDVTKTPLSIFLFRFPDPEWRACTSMWALFEKFGERLHETIPFEITAIQISKSWILHFLSQKGPI